MFFFGIIPWIVLGYFGGLVFARKGYPPKAGIVLGILLGPIGLILFLILPMTDSGIRQAKFDAQIEREQRINATLKNCPECKRSVGFAARFCSRCNYRFQDHASS